MRLHRFYIKGKKLAENGPADRISLDSYKDAEIGALIHQWQNVFRYMVGSQVVLFDDSKTESLALIESMTPVQAELVILEVLKAPEPKAVPKKAKASSKKTEKVASKKVGKVAKTSGKTGNASPELWLLASIVKGDNFDLIVQKTTELGIDGVIPVIADRTIKKNVNLERLKRIAIEAAEQSGRVSVPAIGEPAKLKDAVKSFAAKGGQVILFHQNGSGFADVKDALKADSEVGILIGPEGGWSEAEMKYFDELGLKKAKIGENVLRAETAAISAVTLMKIA
ncbi:MAG TPA: RsmE family RNA methyltransferase [Candidatus Paceibacterota bacterium]